VIASLAAVSAALFIGSLLATPWIVVRLPADYFDARVPREFLRGRSKAVRVAGHFIKNVFGWIFIAAGLAMIVLPGPGWLTLVLGISLADFPRKRQLEARIVGQPIILNGINRIRAKYGKPPLVVHS
jgi:hypothetical protein